MDFLKGTVSFLASIAKEKHNKCLVILSRKEKVYIAEDGEVEGKIETKFGMGIILV